MELNNIDIEAYEIVPIGLALIVMCLCLCCNRSLWDRAHSFGIDKLEPCVPVDIEAYEIVPIGLALIDLRVISGLIWFW